MNNNRCIICGEIIPEGLQICCNCENNINNEQTDNKNTIIK